jgi:menaquinone-specific isochorismate synthase
MKFRKYYFPNFIDPIQWLYSHQIYPKFYWKSKKSAIEIATLGLENKYDNLDEITNSTSTVNVVLNFDLNLKKSQIWIPSFELINSNNQTSMLSYKPDFPDKATPITIYKNKVTSSTVIPNFYNWDKTIREAKTNLQKVVLARKESIFMEKNVNSFSIFSNLKNKSENSYLFFFQPNPHETFLGASPETLFIKNKTKIISESIAGTRKRGENSLQDSEFENSLIKSAKELKEFYFVKDIIESIFKQICIKYSISKTSICKTKWVQHLHAKLIGELKNNLSIKELLHFFHPTPAVGGVPKNQALEFIHQHEKFDRSYYAAPIGRVSKLNSEFAVGIRSCYIKKNRIDVFAGAGIIDSSNPKNEWEELKSKASWIYEVI